jgi:hypothetical protein
MGADNMSYRISSFLASGILKRIFTWHQPVQQVRVRQALQAEVLVLHQEAYWQLLQ